MKQSVHVEVVFLTEREDVGSKGGHAVDVERRGGGMDGSGYEGLGVGIARGGGAGEEVMRERLDMDRRG